MTTHNPDDSDRHLHRVKVMVKSPYWNTFPLGSVSKTCWMFSSLNKNIRTSAECCSFSKLSQLASKLWNIDTLGPAAKSDLGHEMICLDWPTVWTMAEQTGVPPLSTKIAVSTLGLLRLLKSCPLLFSWEPREFGKTCRADSCLS